VQDEPDIYFVATPDRVIAEMLRLGEVGPHSVVYDLGCGDGRTLIAAARDCGARGVGIDIDPRLIAQSCTNAIEAGVQDRVKFLQGNFFDEPIAEATTILLYLLDSLNIQLRPRILAECRPGVRVLSYSFEMGDWEADAHTPMAANGVSLWIVPAQMGGSWKISTASDAFGLEALDLRQTYQKLSGFAHIHGQPAARVEGRVTGEQFALTAKGENGKENTIITGRVSGGSMEGTISRDGIETPFEMRRTPPGSIDHLPVACPD
jgi:SAM-dependent methyltransferase